MSAPQPSKPVVFASSGFGGCLGWLVVHPANTCSIRMSLASMNGQKISMFDVVRQNGIASLYDGLAAGIWRQVFYATSRLGLFEVCRDKLHEIRGKTDFASRVVIGAGTGATAAFISCPIEVACVRMSNDATLPVDQRRNYKGMQDVFTRIYTEEGFGAFYRGVVPFSQRAALVGVFQVATMDQFTDLFAQTLGYKKNTVPNVFCSAMSSGLIYSLATMPLEACKNRMASQKPDPMTGKLPYTSTLQALRTISANEGFLALYNGFAPYYIRCGGHTVCMFVAIQMLRSWL